MSKKCQYWIRSHPPHVRYTRSLLVSALPGNHIWFAFSLAVAPGSMGEEREKQNLYLETILKTGQKRKPVLPQVHDKFSIADLSGLLLFLLTKLPGEFLIANKSVFFFFYTWERRFIASDTLPACLLKYTPLLRQRLLGQVLSLREQRHLLIIWDIAYMKTVNWVFGEVTDVNYIFPGFGTTASVTPYTQVPGVLSAHCLKWANINWWVFLLLASKYISLNALAFTSLYLNIFLSHR